MATKPRKNPVRPKKPKGTTHGRKPAFAVTRELLREVEELVGNGLTNEMMHGYYGICSTTWYRAVQQNPELGIAMRRGKPRAVNIASGKLFEKVKEGNLDAIKFYLRTQGRWSEHNTLAVSGNPDTPAPALTINVSDPVEAARIYQKIMIGD